MINRIKIFVILLLSQVLLFMAGFFSPVLGQVLAIPNPSSFNSLEDIINTLGNLVRPIVIIALIGVVMYGGWVRLTSTGDPEKIALSSKIIVSALVGFGIIVLAPVIVEFLGSLLGISGGLLDSQPI